MTSTAFPQQAPCRAALAAAIVMALYGLAPSTAHAQQEKPSELDAVTVTGIRQSLQKAATLKKDASQIVDTITQEDVGKLPDENVAEALQRVTGVQITRVFGEGQSVSIRGLPQVRVEVDGRTLLGWSARLSPPENEQLGRSSGLDTVPSGLFGRLEVRKSPLASQVEGGLGGSVNLITPDPLDYPKGLLAGKLQASYSDGADKTEPAASVFWAQTFNDDQLGVLLAVDYQERTKQIEAFERNNFFTLRNSDLNSDGVTDVSGDRLHYEQFVTDRSRLGATFEAQLRVNDALTLKTEFIHSELETSRDQEFIAWRYSGKPVTNPVFAGNFIVAGSTTGSLQQAALFREEPTESDLAAVSANWFSGAWTVDADLSWSRGTLDQVIRQITLDSTNRNIPGSFDYRAGNVPSLDLGSFNPADPENFRISQVRANRLLGDLEEVASKLDFRYDFEDGALRAISFGLRAREIESSVEAFRSQITPDRAEILPFLRPSQAGFLSNINGPFPRSFVVADIDPAYVLQRVGGNPLDRNAARDYELTEDSLAAYVMADFEGEWGTVPYRANVGARFVETDLDVDTLLQVQGQADLVPVNDRSSYSNFLPSANIVFYLSDDLLLRFAASRTMQRGGIRELAPSIFVNFTNRTATGGNAQLKPTTADQLDVSLEYYFSEDSLLSGAVFYKDVEDVIADQTVLQEFPGFEDLGAIPFTRPDNIGSAKVKGIELGYQTFFSHLPEPFDGLGMIVNYTYSDAEDDNGFPLVGVSENSYNIVGLYERGRFSSRIAFNARDEAAFAFTEGRPDFIDKRSQLDLQFGWKLTPKLTLQFSVLNLDPEESATVEYSQIGPVALNSYSLSETVYSIGLRGKF